MELVWKDERILQTVSLGDKDTASGNILLVAGVLPTFLATAAVTLYEAEFLFSSFQGIPGEAPPCFNSGLLLEGWAQHYWFLFRRNDRYIPPGKA